MCRVAYTSSSTRKLDFSLTVPDKSSPDIQAHVYSNLPILSIVTHYISTSSAKAPQRFQFSFGMNWDPDIPHQTRIIAKKSDLPTWNSISSYGLFLFPTAICLFTTFLSLARKFLNIPSSPLVRFKIHSVRV